MASDPTGMFGALLGTLQQTGNIGRDATAFADQQQAAKQRLALGAIQLAAAQKERQQQQQYEQDVQSYYQNPTLDHLAQLAVKYPQQAQALKQSYDIMNEAQRQSTVTQMGSIYNAAENGRADILKTQLQQLKNAEQAQGIDTTDIDQALSGLDTDPQSAMRYLKGFAQTHLAAAGVKGFTVGGANVEGKVVGNAIGHYEGDKFVVDYQAPEKPQYRSVDVFNADGDKIGTRLIQIGGSSEGGDPASGDAGAYSMTSAPRSVRNNNPGNLRASAFTKSLPGYKGTDKDGFAVFDSPQAGAGAQAALLKNYMSRGFNTVSKIINRWAPPSDGNDTSAYVQTVAKQLGVNPDDTLSPGMIPQLQSAISRVEGGPNNPSNGPVQQAGGNGSNVVYESVGSQSNASGMSDQAVNNAAAVYNATGQLPTRISQKDKTNILNRAAALNSGNVGDMLAGWGSRKAAVKALGDLQSMTSKVEAFESTALRNGAMALRLGAQVGNDGITLFNSWKNAGRRATSDPQIRAFDAALNTFTNEFAKVTSSATGGGVTSDSARKEAQDLINSADSVEALTKVMQTLTQDMNNRSKGLAGQHRQLLNAIKGGVDAAPSSAPSGFRILRVRPAQ